MDEEEIKELEEIKKLMQSPFGRICLDLASLHDKKNHDYGNAFGEVYQRYCRNGEQRMADGYAAGMLSVKVNRINTLLTTQDQWVKNESIDDSLLDLASYAIMYLVERNER